jgi:hypothetical protein
MGKPFDMESLSNQASKMPCSQRPPLERGRLARFVVFFAERSDENFDFGIRARRPRSPMSFTPMRPLAPSDGRPVLIPWEGAV